MLALRLSTPWSCLTTRQVRLRALYTSLPSSLRERDAAINSFAYIPDHTPSVVEGPLNGMSIAVKDNICTSTMPTTCSSAMLREFTPPMDATVVQLLTDSGASLVGKTNCDEFGMGSLNIHSIHGAVVNPYQPSGPSNGEPRSAGGSSGGSAAAVAAGFCDAALGTDTGGSIRLPASYCGVVGLKPSYGMLSRWGVVSFADSLDCVGILGKDVHSTQRVYDRLSVHDHKDPTCARLETRETAQQNCAEHMLSWASASGDLPGLRIGIPQEYFPDTLSHSILTPFRRLVRSLKARGASIVPVSLPNTAYALSAYYVISSAEASSNLARYDGVQYGLRVAVNPADSASHTTALTYTKTRTTGFGPEVKKRLLLGTYALTADAFDNYFLQAQRVRQLVHQDFMRAFIVSDPLAETTPTSAVPNPDGVHVLLHPSAIRTAPRLSQPNEADSLDVYVQDVLTVPASLAGLPAVSVPMKVGLSEKDGDGDVDGGEVGDGWPVGASLVGQWGCESMVLRVAKAIEDIENI